jgi:hypothetical protein
MDNSDGCVKQHLWWKHIEWNKSNEYALSCSSASAPQKHNAILDMRQMVLFSIKQHVKMEYICMNLVNGVPFACTGSTQAIIQNILK